MLTQTRIGSKSFPRAGSRTFKPPPASLGNVLGSIDLGNLRFDASAASYYRDAEIYGEGECTMYVYKIISGAVRTYKIFNDGRRLIYGFYLAGDLLGLELKNEHVLSAEAISDVQLRAIRRSSLMALSTRDAEVAHELFALTSHELRRARDHMLLLNKSAQGRVASFILEMAARVVRTDETIELPMCRQDIADYLGLTIETISRTLKILEDTGAIELPTCKRIVLRNRSVLTRLNS